MKRGQLQPRRRFALMPSEFFAQFLMLRGSTHHIRSTISSQKPSFLTALRAAIVYQKSPFCRTRMQRRPPAVFQFARLFEYRQTKDIIEQKSIYS